MKTGGDGNHAAPHQKHSNFKDPTEVICLKKKYINEKLKIGKVTFELNTPRAPSGPERIQDAMRRDTAAPAFWGSGVSCSVSASGACSFMLADPLVDLV